MLTLIVAIALSVPPDPVAVDLQDLKGTVLADIAIGKPTGPTNLVYILPYVYEAIIWNNIGGKLGRLGVLSNMMRMKSLLPFVFTFCPALTAADKALLVAKVDQVLADLGP
jgi:hypothetical protein